MVPEGFLMVLGDSEWFSIHLLLFQPAVYILQPIVARQSVQVEELSWSDPLWVPTVLGSSERS